MTSRVKHIDLKVTNTLEAYDRALSAIYANLEIDCFTVRLGDRRVLGVRKHALDALRIRRPDAKLDGARFNSFPKVEFDFGAGATRFLLLDQCTDVPTGWLFTNVCRRDTWISDATLAEYFDEAPEGWATIWATDLIRIVRGWTCYVDENGPTFAGRVHSEIVRRGGLPKVLGDGLAKLIFANGAARPYSAIVPVAKAENEPTNPAPTTYKFKAEAKDVDFARIGREAKPDTYAIWIETDKQRIIMVREEKADEFELYAEALAKGWKTLQQTADGELELYTSRSLSRTVTAPGWVFYYCRLPIPAGYIDKSKVAQAVSKIRKAEAEAKKAAEEKAKAEAAKQNITIVAVDGGGTNTSWRREDPKDFDFKALCDSAPPQTYAFWVQSEKSRVVAVRRDKVAAVGKHLEFIPNCEGVKPLLGGHWRNDYDASKGAWVFSCASAENPHVWVIKQADLINAVKRVHEEEAEAARQEAAKVKVTVEAY